MSKATEDQLSILHNRVAETLLSALDKSDQAKYLLDFHAKKENEDLPRDVVTFLETLTEVHPALLTTATKFLKDNNISCDPSEDEALAGLDSRLKEKRNNAKSNVKKLKFSD